MTTVFFVLIALVIVNKLIYKSYLSPVFLQSIIWLVYYTLLVINIDVYDAKLVNVNQFVLLQAIGFSAGGFLYTLFSKTVTIHKRIVPKSDNWDSTYSNTQLLYPLVIVVLIGAIFFVLRQSGSASIFDIMSFRDELAEDDGKKMGAVGTLQLILSVYVLAYLAAVRKTKWSAYKTTLLFLLFAYFTFLLGSKGMFVSFFVAMLYIFIVQQKIKKSTVAIIAIGFIALIFLLLFLRGGGDQSTLEKENITELVLIYSITSLPALYLLKEKPPLVFGYYSFRVFYIWINKLGYSFPVSAVLNEFTLSPLPGNVYSYLKPYYYDFGMQGVFWMPFILGIVHNLIYFKSNKGSVVFLIFNAMFMFPLIMQVFEENYFRQFSNWVYILMTIVVLTKINLHGSRRSSSNLQPTN